MEGSLTGSPRRRRFSKPASSAGGVLAWLQRNPVAAAAVYMLLGGGIGERLSCEACSFQCLLLWAACLDTLLLTRRAICLGRADSRPRNVAATESGLSNPGKLQKNACAAAVYLFLGTGYQRHQQHDGVVRLGAIPYLQINPAPPAPATFRVAQAAIKDVVCVDTCFKVGSTANNHPIGGT